MNRKQILAVDQIFAVETDPSAPDQGVSYLNCAQCLGEWEADPLLGATFSPKTYARQQLALTATGWQLRCTRHECNIATLALRPAFVALIEREVKGNTGPKKRRTATR